MDSGPAPLVGNCRPKAHPGTTQEGPVAKKKPAVICDGRLFFGAQ
jgi:hypothetical protein